MFGEFRRPLCPDLVKIPVWRQNDEGFLGPCRARHSLIPRFAQIPVNLSVFLCATTCKGCFLGSNPYEVDRLARCTSLHTRVVDRFLLDSEVVSDRAFLFFMFAIFKALSF